MPLLRYLFYRILRWKKDDSREHFPILTATMGVVVPLFFNFFTLAFLSQIYLHQNWLVRMPRERRNALVLSVAALLYIFVRSTFASNVRLSNIEKEFHSESAKDRKIRTVAIWCYLSLTAVAFIAAPILVRAFGS